VVETSVVLEWWNSVTGSWIDLNEYPTVESAKEFIAHRRDSDCYDTEDRFRIVTTTTEEV